MGEAQIRRQTRRRIDETLRNWFTQLSTDDNEKAGREKMSLENIRRFKNNYNFESTCCTCFHPDHIDPRIRVVQETTNESPEVVFS